MKNRAINILLIVLTFGLSAYFFVPNVIKMYACAEGGGNWSWTDLKCTPYQEAENNGLSENDSILLTNTVKEPQTINCPNFDFETFQEQADSLAAFMNLAKKTDSEAREKWVSKFFCAFPNSFKEMQELFGYDNEKGAAPLYDYPIGNQVIEYFGNLNSIPKDKYYDKYINICTNGIWEADNIREAFGFHERLLDDTEAACSYLSKRTDEEIKSVFRFIFDGPHPMNEYNEKIYNQLLTKIESQNKRLAKLLPESYNQLMAEDDGHGH